MVVTLLVVLALPIATAIWATIRSEDPFYIFLSSLGVLVAVVYLLTQGLPRLSRIRRNNLEGQELLDEIDTWMRPLKDIGRRQISPGKGYVALLEVESKYNSVTGTGTDFVCWFGIPDTQGRKNTIHVGAAISFERTAFDRAFETQDEVNLLKYELGLEIGRYGAFYTPPGYQKRDDGTESFEVKFWEVFRVDESFGPSSVLAKFESIARIYTLGLLVIGRNYIDALPPIQRPPTLPSAGGTVATPLQ